VKLHSAVWLWGGTVLLALFALAFLFLLHGQPLIALSLFFGANLFGLLIWLLGISFRRAYPPEKDERESIQEHLDREGRES
jgi:hypothetical protein